ncbi:MAG: dockerin type I domain-containing protein [Planctomycetota bacterium]
MRSRQLIGVACLSMMSSIVGAQGDEVEFLRGDMNGDGRVTMTDASYFSLWLGLGGPPPVCMRAADMDGDGVLGLRDTLSLLRGLFMGTEEIAAPFPACGAEETPQTHLSCDADPVCEPVEPESDVFHMFVATSRHAREPQTGGVDVYGRPGDIISLPIYVHLSVASEHLAAYGWSLGLDMDGGTIENPTTVGTVAAPVDEGGIINTGFIFTEPTADGGAVSSILTSIQGHNQLDTQLPFSVILRARAAVAVPKSGTLTTEVQLVSGLRGSGHEIELEVTADGDPYRPVVTPLEVRAHSFDESEFFKRGDVDQSGGINISDSIFLLNWLFAGGRTPPCLDAANVNDDEQIDISDAIAGLNCLFVGGVCPSFECEVDTTRDDPFDCVENSQACSN